jgi:hypothetical protein
MISPTKRAVRTAPPACEYALPGISDRAGTSRCDISTINFKTLDGNPTVARLVTTPTALLHDPWLNALWFFDGPVLRALQLRSAPTNANPTHIAAAYVETKMTNSTGGGVFADPLTINKDFPDQHVLDFGIQDGAGYVGDGAGAPYSYTNPPDNDRLLVAGLTSPFNGYTMEWDAERNLVFLDPLCGLVRRVTLNRATADALGTAANISTVTVGAIDTFIGNPADCALNSYDNLRRFQRHIDQEAEMSPVGTGLPIGRDALGSLFHPVTPFTSLDVSAQYTVLQLVSSGLEQLPGFVAPQSLLRVGPYISGSMQAGMYVPEVPTPYPGISDGVGPAGQAGFAKYILKVNTAVDGTSDALTPAVTGSFQAGVSRSTFLLAGANTFALTVGNAPGYDEEAPSAMRTPRPNNVVGDPSLSHVRLMSLAVDTSDTSNFIAKVDTIYTASTTRGNSTTPFQVMGDDVRSTHVVGMATNTDGDVFFVNVGATPISTDGAAGGFTTQNCLDLHPGCLSGWQGDSVCDCDCYNPECNFDVGDCTADLAMHLSNGMAEDDFCPVNGGLRNLQGAAKAKPKPTAASSAHKRHVALMSIARKYGIEMASSGGGDVERADGGSPADRAVWGDASQAAQGEGADAGADARELQFSPGVNAGGEGTPNKGGTFDHIRAIEREFGL